RQARCKVPREFAALIRATTWLEVAWRAGHPVRSGSFRPAAASMLTFQQVILKLQDYWGARGCALLQPYDMEVGAGTSHTATFLRALGPEPWRAAYVQPSRRPKDGRYG